MSESEPVLMALIIEDEPVLAEVFEEAVKKAGYATEVCINGSIALERLRQVRPALAVLDLHLPGMSGADLLHEIRTNPILAGTKVILATADPLQGELFQGQADCVMIKPISFHQIRLMARRFAGGASGE